MPELTPPDPRLPHENHRFDVCVVGGGMAGLCAALAAARRGAKVALIHDRPVLGGNASSEVRMWICGAHGKNKKETGLLEEIQLANAYRNPSGNYSIWDSVLYGKVAFEPNLTLFLNTTCCDAGTDGEVMQAIRAWKLTEQTWVTVEAQLFIDCSGDSILAPLVDAPSRWGRERRAEFDEDIAPAEADHRTMGNSLLLQLQEHETAQEFVPPRWAYQFDDSTHLPSRLSPDGFGHNFWWLELGGFQNTITENEVIRHELYRTAFGVWDYMKNRSPQRDQLTNWNLHWVGSLPGKRENRRYEGAHILTQHDVRSGGRFEDIVAYGGWSMDDHHPAGLYYPGPATLFHKAPSPYGIPYRSLYSSKVRNLLFAGRNISCTHVALSSTRVMATCALLGQAAGTAAALCVEKKTTPASLYPDLIDQLQSNLMTDDCWLPGRSRWVNALTREASIKADSSNTEVLRNGQDRPDDDLLNSSSVPLRSSIELEWADGPRYLEALRVVFDSNLNNSKRMPCRYALGESDRHSLPSSLVKDYTVAIRTPSGSWESISGESDNHVRVAAVDVRREVTAIRFTPNDTWGADGARIFSIDALEQAVPHPPIIVRKHWNDVMAEVPEEELRPPDSGLEKSVRGSSLIGA